MVLRASLQMDTPGGRLADCRVESGPREVSDCGEFDSLLDSDSSLLIPHKCLKNWGSVWEQHLDLAGWVV